MQEESERRSVDTEKNHTRAEEEEDNKLNSLVQRSLERKESLGVTFTGRICSGIFKNETTLNVFYVLQAGP